VAVDSFERVVFEGARAVVVMVVDIERGALLVGIQKGAEEINVRYFMDSSQIEMGFGQKARFADMVEAGCELFMVSGRFLETPPDFSSMVLQNSGGLVYVAFNAADKTGVLRDEQNFFAFKHQLCPKQNVVPCQISNLS